MKKILLALVLLIAFAPAILAEEAPATEPLDVEQVEAQAEVVEAPSVEVDAIGLPLTALELASQEATAAYECPPYTTYCRFDIQCDAYCGGAGAGACVFGCCACYF